MEIEEKISHLQIAAMTEARAQAEAIVKQHTDALTKVYNQHRDENIRQSEIRIKAETTKARNELNMASSKASLALKRDLSKVQSHLKHKLFREVCDLIHEYMATEEYTELLVKFILNALTFANGETMTIYINPSDEDKKAFLEEQTGATLTVSKIDFKGGVRAVLKDRNILIDNAFDSAINRVYKVFVFKGGVK